MLASLKRFQGADGITAKFYKECCKSIGSKLVETLNHCKNSGILSVSQRRGVLHY